jgi:L-glutamine-phosphate cytidylyltransferase
MKAIILAAGQGTRLRPLTDDRPKALVEVDGHSLIETQVAVLLAEGVTDIVIVGGYLADCFQIAGTRLYENVRYASTNMVFSLLCARDELREPTLVTYGDIVYSRSIVRSVLENPGDICVAVDLDWEGYWRERFEDPVSDAESLKMDDRGCITSIGGSITATTDVEGQYMGLMKFTKAGLDSLLRVTDAAEHEGSLLRGPLENAYMTDLLQRMIDGGQDVWPALVWGGWLEVDSVDDLNLPITRERMRMIRAELVSPSG